MSARSYRLEHNRGHWLHGQLAAFRNDRLRFLTDNARLAPIVRLNLGPRRIYCLSAPDLVQDVLVTQHVHMVRDRLVREVLGRTMGNSLLTSDGAYWKRQRRMLAPAFHRQQVLQYAESMVRQADAVTDRLRDGQTRDIERLMDGLTLSIATEALFRVDSTDHVDLIAGAITELQEIANRQVSRFVELPIWIPTAEHRRQRALSRRLRDLILTEIRRRRAAPVDAEDLLTTLVRAKDPETGVQMSDDQICDETITLYLAGYDTTALTLSFCWYELARHPGIEARLHAELDEVLAGRLPTAHDIDRLQYTQMLIKETLRLYPPVYFLVREVADPIELGGHRIPKGSILIASPYAMHRDPAHWDRPDQFDPNRFADDAERTWHKYRYFPFGGGPRVCIGKHFALVEATLILATIARRYRFELAHSDQQVELEPQITLGPKDGIPLTMRRRAGREQPV